MRAAVRARGGRDWEYLPFSSRERVAAGSSGSVSDGGTFERREVIGNQCLRDPRLKQLLV